MQNSAMQRLIDNPSKTDKKGPAYLLSDIANALKTDIQTDPENYLINRGKNMMQKQTKKTSKYIDAHTDAINSSIEKLFDAEEKLSATTKNVSQSVRKNTENLKNGLERIQKQADFNSLEKYVSLLERASIAIESLAKIQDSGKLEKIGNALR